eukprot:4719569-Alexandrium_andersonii.AAC.1
MIANVPDSRPGRQQLLSFARGAAMSSKSPSKSKQAVTEWLGEQRQEKGRFLAHFNIFPAWAKLLLACAMRNNPVLQINRLFRSTVFRGARGELTWALRAR